MQYAEKVSVKSKAGKKVRNRPLLGMFVTQAYLESSVEGASQKRRIRKTWFQMRIEGVKDSSDMFLPMPGSV